MLAKLSIMDWRAIAALAFALPYVALVLVGERFGWLQLGLVHHPLLRN